MLTKIRASAVVLSLCMLAGTAVPAFAAAPDNDNIGNAIVISGVPYENTQDASEATSAAADPDCFGPGPTVWYQYTAAEDGSLVARTLGSNYDTTLAVGTSDGTGGLNLLDCNDDTTTGFHSRLRFDAVAGTTYLFMVGAYPGSSPGQLVFSLDASQPVEPLAMAVTVDGQARFDRSGTATLSGVATCSGADFVALDVSLTQRVGRFRINGYGFGWLECSSEGQPWSIEVHGENGTFAGGRATARVEAWACNEEECDFDQAVREVRLRRK